MLLHKTDCWIALPLPAGGRLLRCIARTKPLVHLRVISVVVLGPPLRSAPLRSLALGDRDRPMAARDQQWYVHQQLYRLLSPLYLPASSLRLDTFATRWMRHGATACYTFALNCGCVVFFYLYAMSALPGSTVCSLPYIVSIYAY